MTTDTLIGLGEIAGIIREAFGDEHEVKHTTPFVWWDRSRHVRDIGIKISMPEPVAFIGVRQSPVWARSQIVKWYGEWKGIK